MEAQPDFLPLFKNSADAKQVPSRTVLFAQGDPADVLYVVIDGQIEIRIDDVAAETVGPGGRSTRSGSSIWCETRRSSR